MFLKISNHSWCECLKALVFWLIIGILVVGLNGYDRK